MRRLWFGVLVVFAACGGDTPPPAPDAPANARRCDGRAYDHCTDTSGFSDCNAMECRLFNQAGFTICTPACSASVPCPPDEAGNPVTCNMMGRCRSTAPNTCNL